jgi:protein involved in polysaccharide export with SLBB domain
MLMMVRLEKLKFVLALGVSMTLFSQFATAQNLPIGMQGVLQQGMESSSQALPVANFRNTPSGQVQQNYVSPKPKSNAASGQSEFQQYVEATTGVALARFGSDIVKDGDQTFSPPATAAIPGDYLIGPGDEIFLRAWGSVDVDLLLTVDRAGQVAIPKIGTVTLTGVSHANLNKVLQAAISKTYSGVNIAASMGQLRGIRVYVTGYAQSPGAYTVNNLSSLINVVMAAGGPSSAGSFRNIQLKRAGKVISTFDLYDLLLRGDKSQDRPVTSEDVIHVGPSGPQVAIVGSINKSAVFEIKNNESLQELLTFAGGFVSGANSGSLNYLSLANRQEGFKNLASTDFLSRKLVDGDVYWATSDVALRQPVDKQVRMIRVDGQVNKPGLYSLKPGQTLQDALAAAGGLTPSAYLYGARLERVSVRAEQNRNITNLKQIVRKDVANLNAKNASTGDMELIQGSIVKGNALLSMLDEFKADGRLALSLKPMARNVPPIAVEPGDVFYIPTQPNIVSVTGSVAANQVSLAYETDQDVTDYVELAGGYSRGADKSNIYVVRASGEHVRAGSWFGFGSVDVYPGDAIFVPEDLQKVSWTKELKDWTSIIYQLGLGAAAIKVLQD